jgi:hypothetical protein
MIGIGWSLVQTPAGRVVNRSSSVADRPSYFSAQFSLTHACWMIAYPVAGQLGVLLGIETTAFLFAMAIASFTALGAMLWPGDETPALEHTHDSLAHSHGHTHDDHHQHHDEVATDDEEPHKHEHKHAGVTHSHVFFIDDHHPHWP